MATFSIVVPVYNEEVYIERFFSAINKKLIEGRNYEIIFVNDGSTDYTERILKRLSDENENVRVVTLEKNYGKEAAFVAGMKVASGDAVILMSINPHNPFEAIRSVISKWLAGYEIVHAYRKDDKPGWWKNFKLNLFRASAKLFGINDTILPKPNVELYDRKVADILAQLPDRHTYMRNVNVWIDYKLATIYFDNRVKTEKGQEVTENLKKQFDAERKAENRPDPKPIKKRLYASSLYASVSTFSAFAVLLLVTSLFSGLVSGYMLIKLFGFVVAFGLLITSLMYASRAIIIKRLGKVPGVKTSGEIYKIKELYGFDCYIN